MAITKVLLYIVKLPVIIFNACAALLARFGFTTPHSPIPDKAPKVAAAQSHTDPSEESLLSRIGRAGPAIAAWRDACANEMAALFRGGEIDLLEQLQRYVRLSGAKRPSDRGVIMSQVVQKLNSSGADLRRSDVFGEDGEVNVKLVRQLVPEFDAHYLRAVPIDDLDCIELISESENRFAKFALAPAINKNMARARAAALKAYRVPSCDFYVSAIGYQLFDGARGIYWSEASTRAFPREAMNCAAVEVDKSVVIVQDIFDGSNYSHFLFDWITRLCHFVESGPEDPRECLFVLGGAPGEFHFHVVRAVCDMYSLDEKQFIFPLTPQIWRVRRSAYFFSDLKMDPLHPAQMANPRSVEIMRALGSRIPTDAGVARRIYISRADAHMRRVVNEDEILEGLRPFGFMQVRLATIGLLEQLRLIRGADVIVAPHGMGLTHIAFGEGTPTIIELHNPTIGTDAYAWIALARGCRYRAVLGDDLGEQDQRFTIRVQDIVDALLEEGVSPLHSKDDYCPPVRATGPTSGTRLKREPATAWLAAEGLVVGGVYRCTCEVWLPAAFTGGVVALACAELAAVQLLPAESTKREQWQVVGIEGVALRPQANFALHCGSGPNAVLYSKVWHFSPA
jgi:hypothetical protein